MILLTLLFYDSARGQILPRIETENGNLKFTAHNGKDIKFVTTSGSVYINDADFGNIQTQLDAHESQLQSVTTDHCQGAPCKNQATCINGPDHFYCQCAPGWTGSTCTVDYDECRDTSISGVLCQNGASCTNVQPPRRFECNCAPEFFGQNCGERYDDCGDGQCENGSCVDGTRTRNGEKAFTCVCFPGYELSSDKQSCVDKNECTSRPCYADVKCENTPGSFYCHSCPPGMTGNGQYCDFVDQCAINNGGCDESVTCENTHPGRKCGACPAGYEGNGVYCRKAGPCDTANGGCSPLATCSTDNSGSVSCECIPGYSGTGIGQNGCSADGQSCDLQCVNGHCLIQSGQPKCICYQGFDGDLCNHIVDPCYVNPCLNMGLCQSNMDGSFTCQCEPEWTGQTCEQPIGECGGEFTDKVGSISYPGSGNTYPKNAKCAWTIVTVSGSIIQLTFTVFDLEPKVGQTCHDKVSIYDGVLGQKDPRLIGTYCGKETPKVPDSLTNSIEIDFTSDSVHEATGFRVEWESVKGECGGRVNATQGTTLIATPGYPQGYAPGLNCTWYIDTTVDQVMRLEFSSDFEVGTKTGTNNDCARSDAFVKVMNNVDNDVSDIGYYCGRPNIPVSTSDGPFVTVQFVGGAVSKTGFQLTITPEDNPSACGGELTGVSGEIQSPGYPLDYDNNMNCVWRVGVDEGEQIILQFDHISVEKGGSCNYDKVSVTYGAQVSDDAVHSLTYDFCGYYAVEDDDICDKYTCESLPGPIVSKKNEMLITFKTDGTNVKGKGFHAHWEIGCDGTLTNPGQVTSPYYPNPFPKSKKCQYHIKAKDDQYIILTFDDFGLGGADANCSNVFVAVYDGRGTDDELLLKACGNDDQPSVHSTAGNMLIVFQTDGNENDRGFSATFDFMTYGCGGFYDATEPGAIMSPSFPEPYPENLDCFYYITADPGFILELYFTFFEIEEDDDCDYDYVNVFYSDHADPTAKVGKYCGIYPELNVPLRKFISPDRYITVEFHTDDTFNEGGFTADYRQLESSSICGETFVKPQGTFASPNYPSNYGADLSCEWHIQVGAGLIVELTFTDFMLEHSDGCKNDYVEVYNGKTEASHVLGRYCGYGQDHDVPPDVIRGTNNQLTVKLVTNDFIETKGFQATFGGGEEGCGGTLHGAEGAVHSPNYPGRYPDDAMCEWIVEGSLGSGLILTFPEVSMEDDEDCWFDFVQVVSGNTGIDGPPVTPRLCQETDYVTWTNASIVTVYFESDYDDSGKGFLMNWVSAADNILPYYAGIIQSHNYPAKYPKSRKCVWRIEAPANDWTFNIEVKDFEVADVCTVGEGGDKLRIYQSWDESKVWKEYCNTAQLPPGTIINVTPEKNQFMIIFETDDSDLAHRGFELEFYPDGAFDVLTEAQGELKSFDFETGFTAPATQLWLISIEPKHVVKFVVLEGDLGTSALTFVSTYDGAHIDDKKLISHWTKIIKNAQSVSHNSDMLVYLKSHESDYSRKQIRFKAKWTSEPGGTGECGNEIVGDHGQIKSPGYPTAYPNDVDCNWQVTKTPDFADTDHFIITFNDFALEQTSSCRSDYLAIYHTDHKPENLLAKLCGSQKPQDIHVPPGANFLLQFVTDYAVTDKGFDLSFGKNCGSSEIAEKDKSGFIATGNYPQPYHAHSQCYWTIRTPDTTTDEKIFLQFTHFDTYVDPSDPSNCEKGHYVQIYEGSHPDQDVHSKYCGTKAPPLYVSRGNQVKIIFDTETGENAQRTGFYASYNLGSESCGGTLWNMGMEGEFTPPGYSSGKYLPNLDCEWTVHSSPGNTVNLNWKEAEIEKSDNCEKDRLEIHLYDREGPLMFVCCDPFGYAMVNEAFWVNFVTDDDVELRGWVMHYEQSFGSSINYRQKTRGKISSPLWPHLYPSNEQVWWTVDGKKDLYAVHYVLIEFDVPCADKVRFYDGQAGTLIDDLCGTLDEIPRWSISRTTKTSTLVVNFVSDDLIWGHGFLFEWNFIASGDWNPDEVEPDPINPGTCGDGDLVPAGFNKNLITSPGYPTPYPADSLCVWYLVASSQMSVEMQFTAIDLPLGPICNEDYILAINGPTLVDEPLYNGCGWKEFSNFTIRSTGRYLTLQFVSDSRVKDFKGWSAFYYSVCGGTLTTPEGIISTDHYPEEYPTDQYCNWHIQAEPGHTVQVKFYHDQDNPFNIDGHGPYCNETNYAGDYVTLYNGPNAGSPALQQQDGETEITKYHCGLMHDGDVDFTPLLSTQSEVYVHFKSSKKEKSHSHEGFKLKYSQKQLSCGEELIMLADDNYSGTFQSPNFPDNYPASENCVWIIKAPDGDAVQLDFSAFFVTGNTENCYEGGGFVEIYDVKMNRNMPIAVLCGRKIPSTIKTVGNQMNVKFQSSNDEQSRASGFEAIYSLPDCGGLQTGEEGVIQYESPPRYHTEEHCAYLVQAPMHHAVLFNFTDDFKVPCTMSSGQYVSGDYIEVLEYSSEGYFYLKQASTGLLMTLDVQSSKKNVILAERVTEDALYTQLWYWESSYIHNVQLFSRVLSPETLTTGSQLVGETLKREDRQKWIIKEGKLMNAGMLDTAVGLQGANLILAKVNDQSVVVFEQHLTNIGKRIGLFCNEKPKDFVSRGNEVIVLHYEDASSAEANFTLNWHASYNVCGEDMEAPAGVITSPNYPDPYDWERRCEWTITVQRDRHIVASFDDFDIRTSDGCFDHYVQFYDGIRADSPNITDKLCHTPPKQIASHSYLMRMIFETDYQNGERGFSMAYSSDDLALCGGLKQLPSGELPIKIRSPNYPSNYNASNECHWSIDSMAKFNTSFHFTFNKKFEVEDGPFCTNDKLLFVTAVNNNDYSGINTEWIKLCGYEQPEEIVLPGRMVEVIFQTDSDSEFAGFEMTVETNKCGGILTAENSADPIAPPGYPAPYRTNEACSWVLQVNEGAVVEFTFTTFDVERGSGSTCGQSSSSGPYVKLYNGDSINSPVIDILCGAHKPTIGKNYHTSTNQMVVEWWSQSRVSGHNTGFTMTWGSEEAGCGNQLIQKENGKVTSPNYPQNYPKDVECKWTIQTKPGNHLIFNALNFKLPEPYPSGECEDSLSISDYDEKLIGKYCGTQIPNRIETSRNRASLLFVSNTGNYKGFEMSWATQCGQVISDSTRGILHNQNYGLGPYLPNLDCSWLITAKNPYDMVNVAVVDIDIAGSTLSGCPNDYLAFYKAETSDGSSNLIKKLCGTTGDKISARGEMTIRFVTGSSPNGHLGWRAEYDIGGCGGYQLGTNAHAHDLDGLQSHQVNCTWVMEALGTDDYPEMAIIGEWKHYNIGVTPGCSSDYLKVYDGSTTHARLIGTFCGPTPPPILKSSTKFMTFELVTTELSTGFVFDWVQTLGPAQGCGGIIEHHSGSVSSPNYPHEYISDLFCLWEFQPKPPLPHQGLSLDFVAFDLEKQDVNGRCADYVEVYENADLQANVIFGPECGNLNRFTVKSPTDQNQRLLFVTDSTNQATGFEVKYSYYQLSCGGELVVGDTPVDLNYRYSSADMNSNCIYNIKTSNNHYVHIVPLSIKFPESTSEYKVPITKQAQSMSVLILDAMNAHHVQNVIIAVAQPKVGSKTTIQLCQDDQGDSDCWKFVFNIDNQNRIIYGGMTVTQKKFDENAWKNWQKALELRLTDRSIGLFHQGVEILFHQSNAEYPIMRHDLNSLLVANDGQGGARFTVNSVSYRHNKNEVSLLDREIQVRNGHKVGTLTRFYKLWSFETEIYIDEDPSSTTWKNILTVGHESASTAECGDRMPLISIEKNSKLALHIGSCVNGQPNYVWSTLDKVEIKRKVWYQVEVGQNFEMGSYMYYIKINGETPHKQINSQPVDLSNKVMEVWASLNNPLALTAENTKVRNMRFQTERDGDSDWFVLDGTDCWEQCDLKAGECDFCGSNGYCCSGDKHENNGDCTTSMVDAIKNSDFAEQNNHMCVAMLDEGSCTDWSYEENTNCLGGDILEEPKPIKHGLSECQDMCLQNRPKCVGFVLEDVNYPVEPVRCYLKYELQRCERSDAHTSASIMLYNCGDNHDCGGSFVQFKDQGLGHPIGQEKTYCGSQTPPNFFSYGEEAQVKIQLDSAANGFVPEFRARIQAEVCSREHNEQSDIILSPGYPHKYPSNVDCTIAIKVSDTLLTLQIFFDKFEMENSNNCANDWLQIDNGPKVCGTNLPDPFFKNHADSTIRFHSNDQLEGAGFKMSYLTNYDTCGGSLGPDGLNVYMTPWPGAYSNNMACEWEIAVASDKKAEIQVNQIAIYFNQETGDCYEDEVLEVYQTKPGKRKLLKSLCGTSRSIAPIKSVTNMATLVFKRFVFSLRLTSKLDSALPTNDKNHLTMAAPGMGSL